MIKVAVFPIKICAKKGTTPEELEQVLSVGFEPREDTFNKPDTVPVIDINLMVETDNPEYIDYICSMNWFDDFYTYTNIYRLFRKVNFACNIKVIDAIELTDEAKEKLKALFNVFVARLQTIVEDLDKYATLCQESPIFTITMGTEEEAKENATEEPKEVPVEEVANEPESK